MAASVDMINRLNHVLSFTQTENTSIVYVLRGWFGTLSGIPGALEAGDDAWSNTVMFEHYDSTLDPDVTVRTPEQVAMFNTLKANAQKSQNDLDAVLGVGTNEDNRLNANLAAYVKSLLALPTS